MTGFRIYFRGSNGYKLGGTEVINMWFGANITQDDSVMCPSILHHPHVDFKYLVSENETLTFDNFFLNVFNEENCTQTNFRVTNGDGKGTPYD